MRTPEVVPTKSCREYGAGINTGVNESSGMSPGSGREARIAYLASIFSAVFTDGSMTYLSMSARALNTAGWEEAYGSLALKRSPWRLGSVNVSWSHWSSQRAWQKGVSLPVGRVSEEDRKTAEGLIWGPHRCSKGRFQLLVDGLRRHAFCLGKLLQ